MNLKRLVYESTPFATLLLLISMQHVDRVIYERIQYDRTKLFLYLLNIVMPLLSLVTSGPIALYKLYITGNVPTAPRTPYWSPTQVDVTCKFPHFRYMLMALSSTLHSLLSAVPMPYLGDRVADVLSDLSMPLFFLMSYMVLSTSFKHGQELGLLLVAYGSMINVTPGQKVDQPPDFKSAGERLYFISLYQQGVLAVSAFKDFGLKHGDFELWITNPWISIYQLVFGLASIYINDGSLVSWNDLFSLVCEMCDHVLNKQLTCDSSIFGWFLMAAIFHVIMNNNAGIYFKFAKTFFDALTLALGLPSTYTMYLLPKMSYHVEFMTPYDGIVFLCFIVAKMQW